MAGYVKQKKRKTFFEEEKKKSLSKRNPRKLSGLCRSQHGRACTELAHLVYDLLLAVLDLQRRLKSCPSIKNILIEVILLTLQGVSD